MSGKIPVAKHFLNRTRNLKIPAAGRFTTSLLLADLFEDRRELLALLVGQGGHRIRTVTHTPGFVKLTPDGTSRASTCFRPDAVRNRLSPSNRDRPAVLHPRARCRSGHAGSAPTTFAGRATSRPVAGHQA